MHILGSIRPITLIWASLKDLFLLQKMSVDDANFGQKTDDVRSGRKAEACHGQLWPAQESMG